MGRFFRFHLMLVALVAGGALAAQEETDLSGRWLGTLDVTVTQLRIQLNIRAKSEGGYEVTLDSLDQGANGLPATMVREGNKITVALSIIRSEYTAELSEDQKTMTGVWKQAGRELPLALSWQEGLAPGPGTEEPAESPAAQPAEQEAHAAQLPGLWLGNLLEGTGQLRLLFKLRQDNGMLTGTVDSLDQSSPGLLVQVRLAPERAVRLNVPVVNGYFEGALAEDGKSLKGTWHQGGSSLPLTLAATDKAPDLSKPQEPKAPFPYRSEEVRFPGGAPGVTLAGTLTLPEGKGPFPAVVLVSGSGPQDRDEALLGHKPFLVLADHLTRAGIAVLRYDDRGFGASTGEFPACTTRDFADDAAAAFSYLRSRHEVRPKATGILGHSEGAMIAVMVAAERPEVRFIVSLSGPAVSGDQILLAQSRAIDEAERQSGAELDAAQAKLAQAVAVIRENRDARSARAAFEAQLKAAGEQLDSPENSRLLGFIFTKWMIYFLTYDPSHDLRKLACSALFLYGDKDLQVLVGQNRPALEAILKETAKPLVEVRTLPGLNHLYQTTTGTGSPSEYAAILETMAPAALSAISTWINGAVAPQ